MADAQWLLPAPGGPNQQQIGCFVQPGVAGGERHHACLAEHWHGREVEVVEGFAGWQAGLDKMTLDPATAALGNLEFSEHREKPCRRPTLLVSPLGEVRPEPRDGRQAQIVQQKRQSGGIDLNSVHGCTHPCGAPSKAS
jgi:hypothetical protein